MRVLITGATGYLGTAMLEKVPAHIKVIPTGHSRGPLSLDVTDPAAVRNAISRHRPAVVVHLAAVSRTASAAEDPHQALAVNVDGARVVATETGRSGIRLVALSSDLVFDGQKAPYAEDAVPHPINEYGASKLAGEEAIAAAHPDPLIIRTTVLVGQDRADRYPFSTFVLEQARAGHPVELFVNERRNFYPVTSAAQAVWECTAGDGTGILHIGATESASRFEFGRRLLRAGGLDPDLAIPATGPPDRPADLTLNVDRAQTLLAAPLPTMEEAIAEIGRDMHLT